MEVAFIYVCYGDHEDVVESILSLKALASKSGIDCEVSVLDNSFSTSSQLRISLLIDRLEHARDDRFRIAYYPSDENLGFGKACNKGVELCRSQKIIFVNCDTRFDSSCPQSLTEMLDLLDDKQVAVVGPKVVNAVGHLQNSCFSFDPISILFKPLRHLRRINSRTSFIVAKYRGIQNRIDRLTYAGMSKDAVVAVDWVSGCFMATTRGFLNAVGGFDEKYFLYFEDVDLCRKARHVGRTVLFDPRMSVEHEGRHASGKSKGLIRSISTNNIARIHLLSWLRYIVKWRRDFLVKFQIIYLRIFQQSMSTDLRQTFSRYLHHNS